MAVWNCRFLLLRHKFSGSIGEVGAKKCFTGHRTANTIQLFVVIKGIFLVFSFSIKRSHLFICTLLKYTLSSRQKPVSSDMTISKQIAFAAIFYFGQVFVFCELEWFLLIICKEHTLSRSQNMFLIMKRSSADAPVQNPITNIWTVTFPTYESVCLEFLRISTSEIILKNKATVQFS